jgi:hypothetical protein
LEVGIGEERLVPDGRVRFIFTLRCKNILIYFDPSGGSLAFSFDFSLQQFATVLLTDESFSGIVAKRNQPLYPLHLGLLTISLFLFFDQRLFFVEIVIVVLVVEFVHLLGSAMGVVPDELLWLVELFGFEELFGLGVGRVGQDGFQVMVFDG